MMSRGALLPASRFPLPLPSPRPLRCLVVAAGLGLSLLTLGACSTQPAARVNGEVITRAEHGRDLESFMDFLSASQGIDWSRDPRAQAALPRLSGDVLENQITTRLARQQAKADGIIVSERAIDERIAQLIAQLGGREAFLDWLATRGFNAIAFRQLISDTLVRERLIERHVPAPPTEIEVRRVRHVLVDSAEKASAVRARLASGESWEKVAAELSLDPSTKARGGDLGDVQRGQTVAAFDQAAFALAPNELSGVVQTQFGYHVLMATDARRQPATPQQIREEQQAGLDRYLAELRGRSTIETALPAAAGGPRATP